MALKKNKKKIQPKKIVKPVASRKAASKNSAGKQLLAVPQGVFVEGIGRRKSATARVRIYPKTKGDFSVNGVIVGQYFASTLGAATRYHKPLEVTGTRGQFAITAKVSGSGVSGQLDAVVHGLSRALAKHNPEYRTLLKSEGLLTRDDRTKETRKIGTGGKARRKRQSPKR